MSRFDTPAVLDMAWSHSPNLRKDVLALADASSSIRLYSYSADTGTRSHSQTILVGNDTSGKELCLSLDWNNKVWPDMQPQIATSLSSGSIHILSDSGNGEFEEEGKISNAHSYEPWIVGFDYWKPKILYTGGDDCLLKMWDTEIGLERPAAVHKNFDAGVTTLQSHHLSEHLLAVGSYDASVRIFDKRSFKTPLASHNVGGGVWRVRWHPSDPLKLLCACMHDGFKVLHISDSGTAISTTARFDAHGKDALAYGVDWCQSSPSEEREEETFVASCSFYDHQLRSWKA